ncbi:MAG: NADH dehydrogenase [Nitrospinae bacterium RIFCSPHIGHO2_02_FULL_39_82]|nr:MAG: NADH dehydrogenase [Nitrospinae bacterium RIFCSPHIGHO2_12_FULL_39_42]OGV99612.1 MAG: NADH dehydrogenase [Nitrospinae bacterium RIFCSPHIGHO2_02_FULL_39_82]OGW12268.1 MAG: NADH dehydrogenase [Nitrospinae bacterium RIFCSPLOWO2_12_FULL_39_93]
MELSVTLKKLKDRFPDSIIETHSFRGDETAIVKKEKIIEICKFLRDDEGLLYNFMMDLTAVDYIGREPRFEVVYHLYSLKYNRRVRIKAPVSESDCTIDSIISIWIAADWFEREAYDLYGIIFRGHPNLKRILLYEGFEGHPLRKDYPVKGRQPLIGPKD